MIKQEITWHSIKDEGVPQAMKANGYQLLVKNKRYGWYEIKDAFYNFRLNIWFESSDNDECAEIKESEYDILYYTSDLGFRAIDKFFSNIKE